MLIKVKDLTDRYDKAVNPLEYSVDTGVADKQTDFNVIAKDVPCQAACPAKTNIPEYIRLIKEGKVDEAHKINQQDNVLPGVLGRICTHPCEDNCRHNWTNTQGPVRICYLKRSAADGKSVKSQVLPPYFPATGKKVAIVGAGPSGLAAARECKRFGHEVVIYEKESYAGGQVRMGVPEFRLPHDVLQEDIDAILDSGIEVKYNQALFRAKVAELCIEYDAVLVAAGANIPRALALDGLVDGAVTEGLNFMKQYNDGVQMDIGDDVLIIGGGFTAVDCSRSARRINPKARVVMMYRRGVAQMAATDEEMVELAQENIEVQTLVSPVRAEVKDGKIQSVTFTRNLLSKPDESGRTSLKAIPDSEFTLACSTLIAAIGQTAEKEILPDGVEIKGEHNTSIENLFVSGDFSMGNGDVINAVADGKAAANEIDTLLNGGQRREIIIRVENADETGRIREYDMIEPAHMPTVSIENRQGNTEVETGFTENQTEDHSKRCYYCNFKFEIDQDICIHCDWCIKVSPRECIHRVSKLEYDNEGRVIDFEVVSPEEAEKATYIWIDSDSCIRCGYCFNICPVNAITRKKADRCPQ